MKNMNSKWNYIENLFEKINSLSNKARLSRYSKISWIISSNNHLKDYWGNKNQNIKTHLINQPDSAHNFGIVINSAHIYHWILTASQIREAQFFLPGYSSNSIFHSFSQKHKTEYFHAVKNQGLFFNSLKVKSLTISLLI